MSSHDSVNKIAGLNANLSVVNKDLLCLENKRLLA